MNGGPGSPAFLYVNKGVQSKLFNPIQGWFGHQKPFDFSKNYIPAKGIDRFASGTPSILSMAAMEAGVDLVLEAEIKTIREKSTLQSELFLKAVEMFPNFTSFRIFFLPGNVLACFTCSALRSFN